MNKAMHLTLVVGMTLCLATKAFAGPSDVFSETYEETELLTIKLFALTSVPNESGEKGAELSVVDKLLANSELLNKSATSMGKADSAREAWLMTSYLQRIKDVLQTGNNRSALDLLLARYYVHYSNCIMLNPVILRDMQHDHVVELQAAIDEGNKEDILQLAEHLRIHSDQMYYAASIFGRKIWEKFAIQARDGSREIFETILKEGSLRSDARLAEVRYASDMLRRLVR